MSLLPRIGWTEAPRWLVLEMGLSLHRRWEVWRIEWFDITLSLAIRERLDYIQ